MERTGSITISACDEWQNAVRLLAKLDGAPTIASFIDHAIEHYVRANGWSEPPPRVGKEKPPRRDQW